MKTFLTRQNPLAQFPILPSLLQVAPAASLGYTALEHEQSRRVTEILTAFALFSGAAMTTPTIARTARRVKRMVMEESVV